MSDWWHHLWHDPMNENPASLAAAILLAAALVAFAFLRPRRRK